MSPALLWGGFAAILRREWLRTLRQRGRLIATIVRPLVWLAVFAVGFRNVLGLPMTAPYQTYILYEVYIVPGLVGLMLLFHGMLTSLALVYDREMGSMRVMLMSPLPRWYLLGARILASTLTALPLVYLFLLMARWWDVRIPWLGYAAAAPAILLASLMLGALGLLLSAAIRQLENFAGVMNFLIFPAFFASTALYPLWRLDDVSPWLGWVAWINPVSHAVELVRFALYLRLEPTALTVVLVCTAGFFLVAVWAYEPGRGYWNRRGLAGG